MKTWRPHLFLRVAALLLTLSVVVPLASGPGSAARAADEHGTISVEPDEVDFGAVALGDSRQRTITVRNIGDGPLEVDSVGLETRSFAEGEYSLVSDAATGASIAPGDSRAIVAEFAPKFAHEGPPAAVSLRESLAGRGLLVSSVFIDPETLQHYRWIYDYFRNVGGPGTVEYEAVASYRPYWEPEEFVESGRLNGAAAVRGGRYYAARAFVPVSGLARESRLELFLPVDFHSEQVLQPPSWDPNVTTVPRYAGVEDVQIQRVEDAVLVLQSNDPATGGGGLGSPAGTFVPLFGEGLADGDPDPDPPIGDAERWFGPDRFATAAAVSAAVFPDGADVAFVATGANFPDALAGGPAGGLQHGPILLTGRDTLPQATITELQRLDAENIVVLGGPGAVSAAVANQLQTYLP